MPARPEITIIGAGPAGCTLALLSSALGLQVNLYEAGAWVVPQATVPRTLALTERSWTTLGQTGISIEALERSPIRTIHVSQQNMPGQIHLAADAGEAFGWTVSYDRLLQALRARVNEDPRITVFAKTPITEIRGSALTARLHIENTDGSITLRDSPLLVVAEGGKGLPDPHGLQWTYGTSAISCHLALDRQDPGLAFERFTRQGPVALLPTPSGAALIWTGPNKHIQRLLALNDQAFLDALQNTFGDRAGRFLSVSPRMQYPLRAQFSLRTVGQRVVRIANAAQALHPVAGQGFNLGLRDVSALISALGTAPSDPGHPTLLKRYRHQRHQDRWITGALTHLMASGFTLPLPGVRPLSALLFVGLELSPTLKHRFADLMANGVSP